MEALVAHYDEKKREICSLPDLLRFAMTFPFHQFYLKYTQLHNVKTVDDPSRIRFDKTFSIKSIFYIHFGCKCRKKFL